MTKTVRFNLRRTLAAMILATIVTTASVASAAGGISGATVNTVEVGSSTTATVYLTTAFNNPACQVSTAMIFDHTTARGKSLLTLLTSAQLSGKKVNLTGTGTCTTISGLTWESVAVVGLTNL